MDPGLPSFGIFQSVAYTGPQILLPCVVHTVYNLRRKVIPAGLCAPERCCGGVPATVPPWRSEWCWLTARAQVFRGIGVEAMSLSSGEGGGEGIRSPQQVLCEGGCSPGDSSAQSRAGGTRPALPWQLLAKPVPSGDARGRGQWEGSISDTGPLTVREREREAQSGKGRDRKAE